MGAIPGNQLSYNSESIETDASSWSVLSSCTLAQSTVQALDGTHSLLITSTASGAADAICNTANQAYPTVTVGNVYQFFYAAYCTSAGLIAAPVIDWYNGASYLSTSSTSNVSLTQNAWTWVSVSGTAPATATLARIYPEFTATASSQLCYVDEIYFGPATSFPSFGSGGGPLSQRGGLTWQHQFRKQQAFQAGPQPFPGTALLQGTGSLTGNASIAGAAGLDGAGSLIAGGEQDTTAGITGAGSLIAGGTIAPAEALTGTGRLATADVQGAGAALIGTGTLTGVGTSVGAVLTGTASLTANGTISPVAVLTGTGSVIAASTISPVAALIGTGHLAAGPGFSGFAALTGAGSVIAASIISPVSPLIAAGSVLAASTISPVAALIGTGTLGAVGFGVNAALIGTATVTANATQGSPTLLTGFGSLTANNLLTFAAAAALTGAGSLISRGTLAPVAVLVGTATLTAAATLNPAAQLTGTGSVIAASTIKPVVQLLGTGSILTAAIQSPALEAYNFGSFPQIPANSAITSVTVVISEWATDANLAGATFQLWDGTSAQIGTTAIGNASTSPYNLDIATFTGVSYSQLATLRVRIFANAGTALPGAVELANSVSLTVVFTPSTNVLIPVSVLRVTSAFPAATTVGSHSVTVTPATLAEASTFPAVTAGQLSVTGHPAVLTCPAAFPAVTIFNGITATITVSTLAVATNVVAALVIANAVGPDYAGSADIIAGGVGNWVSPAGVIGPPDAKDASWTRP